MSQSENGVKSAMLYFLDVAHLRHRPFRHTFKYKVYSLLLDIDRIAQVTKRSRLLRHNKFGLMSFYEKDHGPRDGSPLRPWVMGLLRKAGVRSAISTIRLLSFPRVLGYQFNPIAIYYCDGPDGDLRAVIYQVHNTFGEAHAYVIPVPTVAGATLTQHADKVFHVSPFMNLDSRYGFRLARPGDRLKFIIRQTAANQPLLTATMMGTGQQMSDTGLLRAFFQVPFMTLQIIFGIHWQALRLWIKGARYHSNPKNRPSETSTGLTYVKNRSRDNRLPSHEVFTTLTNGAQGSAHGRPPADSPAA